MPNGTVQIMKNGYRKLINSVSLNHSMRSQNILTNNQVWRNEMFWLISEKEYEKQVNAVEEILNWKNQKKKKLIIWEK